MDPGRPPGAQKKIFFFPFFFDGIDNSNTFCIRKKHFCLIITNFKVHFVYLNLTCHFFSFLRFCFFGHANKWKGTLAHLVEIILRKLNN